MTALAAGLRALLGAALLFAPATTVGAPAQPQTPVSRGIAANPDVGISIWIPEGSIQLIAWDRDSVHVSGRMAKGGTLFFGGGRSGMKFGVDQPTPTRAAQPAHLTAHVPRGAKVVVRTAGASIEARDVSGWFNSVSGRIRASGTAREIQAEAIDGSVELTVTAPHVRARTGGGTLSVGGRVEDVVASTVSGGLTITASDMARGRFESVTGAIRLDAAVDRASSIEVDNHGGSVELRLPSSVRADFDLTSVAGSIINLFDKRAPTAGRQGRGQELSFVTDAKGARIIVRTFKGTITLRRE